MNDQQENTERRQEEITSPQAANEPPKKKFCILTKILISYYLVFFGFWLLAIICSYLDFDIDTLALEEVGAFLMTAFFLTPLLAIASLIRINLNPERFRGKIVCILLLLFSCFINFMSAYMMAPRARAGHSPRLVCGTNLKGLGVALQVYAYEHDGYLPSDSWCDRMIEEVDVSPRSLQCRAADSEEGESDYCLNIHAAERKLSELPADMVLLFEYRFVPAENQIREPIKNREGFSDFEIISDIFTGKEEVYINRWNQVGGPELLAFDRHENGCNILFADGHAEFVKTPELANLKWDIEDEVRFTPEMMTSGEASLLAEQKQAFVFTQTAILLTILGGICIAVTLYILIRFNVLKYLLFVLCIAIFSAGTGLFFGNWSEAAYLSKGMTGLYSGGFFGLLVGICFAVLLANLPGRIKSLRTFVGFAASVGMVTGVVCSTLVHLALIIVNKETNFAGILIGIPYGIAAGAVLGFISGFIFKRRYKPKSIEPITEIGETE